MTKLNPTIYNKLLLQAEEAKSQGLTKLADGILNAIGSYPEEETIEYSYTQLQDQIHRDLWKLATHFITYYGIESADAEKLDETISICASKLTNELESTLGVDSVVKGPFEPKILGEE